MYRIDWGGLPVTDVFPQRMPDLFSGKPLVVSGRYTAAANGTIHIRGKRAGEKFVREIPVSLTANAGGYRIQPSFWARLKIDALMSQDWAGLQAGTLKPALQKEITQLGLDYRLMTQFTSFVAVEEQVVTKDGKPVRVEVPVEMPEGVSYDGVLGEEQVQGLALNGRSFSRLQSYSYLGSAKPAGGGVGSGSGGGVAGGVIGGPLSSPSKIPAAVAPPPPPPPTVSQVVTVMDKTPSPVPKEQKPTGERATLESKLDPALLTAFDCWKKSGPDCKLVPDGTVEIQVWLTDDSGVVLEELKALGFTTSQARPKEKVIVGHLAAEKLAGLAKIRAVRFVSPVRR